MEPGKIDLVACHGRRTINLHDVFSHPPRITDFLRDYSWNENRSIFQRTRAGYRIVWSCTSAICKWEVQFSKKAESKRANTKNHFAPPNSWFVSALSLEHSPSCDSVGECSAKQLKKMKGFKGSIVKGLSSARERVTEALKKVDHVNVDHRPALVYRAIAEAKRMMDDTKDNYDILPAFLNSFARQNPGSRVCCQLDSKGRFFRAFLAVGSIIAAQDSWVPILECDGTHMKNDLYNGICVLVVGKDGNWTNVPCVIAFVHKETASNFEWVFSNCVAAGIKFHDRALFSDRGKQRDAQLRLQQRGIKVHLKFCSLHIYFNVCDRFRAIEPNIERIKPLVFRLQSTTTLVEYDAALQEIDDLFPAQRTIKKNGSTTTQTAAEYLGAIHPRSWTKFGNCSLTPEETAAVATRWNDNGAYGDACALFAGRTTSAVEGQNYALLREGIRDSQVLGAILKFCNLVAETLAEKKTNASNWTKDKHTVTPRAKKMFDRQVWGATACSVRKSTGPIYVVEDTELSLDTGDPDVKDDAKASRSRGEGCDRIAFTVNLDAGTCTRCADREHLQLPCRHIIAALFQQSGNYKSTSGAFKYFHSSFTSAAYNQAFQHSSLSLPFVPALLPDERIAAPPVYCQAGRTSSKVARDVSTREKRIPSRGEPRKSAAPRAKQKQPTAQEDRVAAAAEMQEHFAIEVRAAVKQKRAKYTCSKCGKAAGHNAASCKYRADDRVDSEIIPGNYIVGNCPLELLGHQNDTIVSDIEIPSIISEYSF